MLTAFVTSLAILSAPAVDKWDIKPSFTTKTVVAWNVTVDAHVESQDHHAKFRFERTISSADAKSAKAKIAWKDLEVDDNPNDVPGDFQVTMGMRGELLSSESTEFGDDLRRMLAVFSFVYPEKPIDVGDKWTFDMTPANGEKHKLTITSEVVGTEKLKGVDALKISTKLEEKGENGMSSKGFFWISKEGKSLRYELDVKNWVVPMAGSGQVEAKIKGEAVEK